MVSIVMKLLLKKRLSTWDKLRSPTTIIRDGGTIKTFHGETNEKIIRSHTIIRISKVKAQDSNKDRSKAAEKRI